MSAISVIMKHSVYSYGLKTEASFMACSVFSVMSAVGTIVLFELMPIKLSVSITW